MPGLCGLRLSSSEAHGNQTSMSLTGWTQQLWAQGLRGHTSSLQYSVGRTNGNIQLASNMLLSSGTSKHGMHGQCRAHSSRGMRLVTSVRVNRTSICAVSRLRCGSDQLGPKEPQFSPDEWVSFRWALRLPESASTPRTIFFVQRYLGASPPLVRITAPPFRCVPRLCCWLYRFAGLTTHSATPLI